MHLRSDCSLDEILMLLDTQNVCAVLFVDHQPMCKHYSQQSWVQDAGQVVEVDQEIVDHFQIGKVPQWRFYLKANEVHHAVGTIPKEQFEEERKKIFGNLTNFK